jgi:hypothetical protein
MRLKPGLREYQNRTKPAGADEGVQRGMIGYA